jgi:hypothetical protein
MYRCHTIVFCAEWLNFCASGLFSFVGPSKDINDGKHAHPYKQKEEEWRNIKGNGK